MAEERLLSLIGRIYEAAMDSGLWPDVLNDVADWVGGTACHFYLQDLATNRILLMYATRTDPTHIQAYADHYGAGNPWAEPFSLTPAGKVVRDDEIFPREKLVGTEFFNEHLRARQVTHALGAVVLKNRAVMSALVSYRGGPRGVFEPPSRRAMDVLVPHLQRAVHIAHKVSTAQYRAEGAAHVLDQMPYGVLLLNGKGKVLHANRLAEEILAQRDGLTVEHGELRAALAEETRRIREQVFAATGRAPGLILLRASSLSVSRPSQGRPFAVVISALPEKGFPLFPDAKPKAVVLITDPDRMSQTPGDVLQRLYGLTRKEAAVATLIVEGHGLQHAAELLNISVETARSHLKQIMQKTGTNRQAEVVRLILSGPARIRA
jgi:DNA-binding CsgD family transcriptional regulator/PAS domain-containing protein